MASSEFSHLLKPLPVDVITLRRRFSVYDFGKRIHLVCINRTQAGQVGSCLSEMALHSMQKLWLL